MIRHGEHPAHRRLYQPNKLIVGRLGPAAAAPHRVCPRTAVDDVQPVEVAQPGLEERADLRERRAPVNRGGRNYGAAECTRRVRVLFVLTTTETAV